MFRTMSPALWALLIALSFGFGCDDAASDDPPVADASAEPEAPESESPEPEALEPESPEPESPEPESPPDMRDRAPLAAPRAGTLSFRGAEVPMQAGFFFAPAGEIPGLMEPALVFQADDPSVSDTVVWIGFEHDDVTGRWGIVRIDDGAVSAWSGEAEMFDFREDGLVERVAISGALTNADGEAEAASLTVTIGGGAIDFDLDLAAGTATLRGTLGATTLDQMRYLTETFPEVTTLVLANIQGSENDEANLQTGRHVRASGLNTRLLADSEIYSGGVDLFCAGNTRQIAMGATVGVHAWGLGDMSAHEIPEDHPQHVAQVAYFTEMMGPTDGPAFYWFTIQAAPAAGMHIMTPEELAQYKLATE